ncbi:GNAT family N-acetyltransferase [Aeromicrobium sp. P5_D10]
MTTIEQLDPNDDKQFADYHAAYRAGHDEQWDRPYSAKEQRAELLQNPRHCVIRGVVARDEVGAVVGMGYVELPQRDNLDLGYIDVRIAPEHRRRGHGSAVLARLDEILTEADRHSMFAEVAWNLGTDGSAHTAFAEAHGFTRDLVDAHRVLALPADVPSIPARDGYTLITWRGPCPQKWVEQYANLLTLIVQEAPSGEFALENEFYDAERVRSDEQLWADQGRTMQVVAAQAPSGELAGHTQLVFSDTDPTNAYQWDTLVLAEHRGHGLGLALKARAMHEAADLLAGRREVHTFNAASNGPMIAVNETLGYRQVRWVGEYVRSNG